MSTFRIGIDVGGTFTHAVALNAASLALVAQAAVPTTHRAPRGVAEGVVEALKALLDSSRIVPAQVEFLAYSTTQVTNALLEGDVVPVGIVAVGSGATGKRAEAETRLGDIELAPGHVLHTIHTYLDHSHLNEPGVEATVQELVARGAQAVVAAEAFSVDDPARERMVMSAAQGVGLPATGTHEISGRYGLRVRTRTAVINASLLPKAITTADATEKAVQEIGIRSPLMVVRSDGGVMSVQDLRRRPLLTLLSGPAAGVAAALMYVRVSEGVFMEVGGTSTDVTAIQHGRALLRTGEVGGHRLFLRTLDVRTIGVAGGSMPRIRDHTVRDVGPRSAHLAGLAYACFADTGELEATSDNLRPALVSPIAGDPGDYAVIELGPDRRLAITPTCAANATGEVPEGDWAHGNLQSARLAFAGLGKLLGESGDEAAESVLRVAAQKATRTVETLLADRGMSPDTTELIAGGGGASVLVPPVGRLLNLPVRIAPNASVVSAIGTALAAVREVVERTVPEAGESEMLQIRREAAEAVIRAGADPETVSVDLEYDARTAILRAIATGQTELRERDLSQTAATDEERRAAAAKSLRVGFDAAQYVADGGLLKAYRGTRERRRFLGLFSQRRETIALVDHQGVVRLLLRSGVARSAAASVAREVIAEMVEQHTRYGDAGAELPYVFLGVRGKIVNLSGLTNTEQVLALAQAETSALAPEESILIAMSWRGA